MITGSIFKANDVRGVVSATVPGVPAADPSSGQWDLRGAWAIGMAYGQVLKNLLAGAGQPGPDPLNTDTRNTETLNTETLTIVLGRDMRAGGQALSTAFMDGVREQGIAVLDSGLSSTDQLWFASGWLNLPGVQFTASHNPADYNGIKFCLGGAAPVSPDFLVQVRDTALALDASTAQPGTPTAELSTIETLAPYAAHLHSLVDLSQLRPLTVVVDAGNGMAGHTVHAVLDGLDISLVGLYLDLDGSFPNHPPNPLEPANLVDAQRAVLDHGADLGLVFDGDADRCFIIDELGQVVAPSTVTALIAHDELQREPGATIVVNTVTSLGVHQVVKQAGGQIVVAPVGHTHIKAAMARHDAIFGGEHSAHYYFRDFWGADTGMLAALHVLALAGGSDRRLSEVFAPYASHSSSGELNSTVADQQQVMTRVAAQFAPDQLDHTDGLTIRGEAHSGPWWINLRPSNTEPLLRLNVEASDPNTMEQLRDQVLGLIASTPEPGDPADAPRPDRPGSEQPAASGSAR